jgi:D-glucosaminate-6-phosphate ammonia-lyase
MELIRAAYAQNRGIGRGMKIGKEGILGLMAALEVWEQGGAKVQQSAEQARIQRMVARLDGLAGIRAEVVWPAPDPYPIMRAKVTVDPVGAGLTATALTVLLAEGNPSVRTRSHHVDEGYFLIDPFNLTDAEGDYICERIIGVLALPAAQKAAAVARLSGLSAADLWAATGPWPYFEAGT